MPKRPERAPMVGWYDPGQLAKTGVEVAISTIFGRESDFRALEALKQPQDLFTCACNPDQPVWIDYVGDSGDGWNSTYTVAYWLAQPELHVATTDGKTAATTHTGRVLVFGGDEVYPTANRAAYERRLVGPYKAAREHSDEPYPELYAIPGNHDWYDNLVSFTRLFCDKEWFAGWQTRQNRSYFVLQLPHGWWIVGTDIQLGSDIDHDQLEYFKTAAKKMHDGDRVILCTAEPHWVYAEMYRKKEPDYYNEKTLSFLESRIFGDRIQLFLAGDLHHYRRHEGEDRRQKITAGGGGAFLHPTHGPDVSELHQDVIDESAGGGLKTLHTTYKKRCAYPDEKTSRRLAWRNLLFPLLNPRFGVVTAFLYLLVSWSILASIGNERRIGPAVQAVLHQTLLNPAATFLVLAVVAGFIFFTETHYRWFRFIGGGTHALLHLVATFFIGWGAAYFVVNYLHLPERSSPQLVVSGLIIMIVGWVVGSNVLGLYLLLSLNLFSRHTTEAFSSLRIEDYKNFLRMRIDPDGGLTIFPIGVQKAAKKWTESSPAPAGPRYEPAGDFTRPFLIEEPIYIAPTSKE